jgi:hypothetical protein
MVGGAGCGFPPPKDVGLDASDIGAGSADASIDLPNLDAAEHVPYLEPRYLPNVCDAVATLPAFVADSGTIDTSQTITCTGGTVVQDSPPEICVVRYGSITVPTGVTLKVIGSRALAFVADSSVTIDGVLNIGAVAPADGPGGGTVLSGSALANHRGGGGAGFATAGANGGADTDGTGAAGGGKATDPSLLTALVGGTRSARGPGAGIGLSGGGGGAATLIACRGQVAVSGTIAAGGGGGGGGSPGTIAGQMFGGAGGGAGGNVVLQGLSMSVTGQMFANGGGGGAGCPCNGVIGATGLNGAASMTPAAGGSTFGNEGGGGSGGVQGTLPAVGLHPPGTANSPGGGGGSIGFFQTYTPMGVIPALAPIAASPTFGPNKVINTR